MEPDNIDVFVACDVGKQSHYAVAHTMAGDEVIARGVTNSQPQLEQLLDDAAVHGRPVVVIDQPGSIGQMILAVARDRGVPIAYVPGLVMRRAADLFGGDTKTDPADARVLAEYARRHCDRLQWLEVTDDLLVHLEILSGHDNDLRADANRAANRCRDVLTAIHPPLERVLGPRLGKAGVRALLALWPTPAQLRRAGKARIRAKIAKRSPRIASKVADQIWDALAEQTLQVAGTDTYGRVIATLAEDLDRLHARRDALTADLEEALLAHPLGPVLTSMPGIGTRTGTTILVEIGDPARFADGNKLAAYAGLAPAVRRSGTSIDHTAQSRRGNHRLKNAMFLSAFASLHTPASRAYYDRHRANGKRHNAAIICLARRRCNVILAMLKTATPYQPTAPAELVAAA